MKTCIKCEIEKPLTEFYLRNDTGNYRKDCKDCLNKAKKLNRERHIKNNNIKLLDIDKSQKKTCSVCNKSKELSQFSIYKGNKSGFYSWCLECSRQKDKNREKIVINYTINDIKTCNKCSEPNKVLGNYNIKQGTKDGYNNICNKCLQVYRKDNAKKFYIKKKNKLDTNLQFKLSENIRSRIRGLCKREIVKPKTEKLIGCTLNEFLLHLSSNFYGDITLENYGDVWHLDHIIPCNFFDLTDIEQLNACCHYTNIQPLLIKDNSQKSDKLDWIHPIKKFKPTFLRLVISGYLV